MVHGSVLTDLAVVVHISVPPGPNHAHAVIKSVIPSPVQQLLLFVGIDGQIILNQIQVVIPMIAPIPLSESCLDLFVSQGNQSVDQLFLAARDLQLITGYGIGNLSRCKRPAQDFGNLSLRVSHMPLHQRMRLLPLPFVNPEGTGTNLQRIIAVHLDQTVKMMYVEVSHGGTEKHVVASILAHVPVIAVALGIILSRNGKEIIIPLRVSVLSAEEMHHRRLFPASQHIGISAPQEVIQIALLYILVKQRIGRPGPDVLCKGRRQLSGLPELIFPVAGSTECRRLFVQ